MSSQRDHGPFSPAPPTPQASVFPPKTPEQIQKDMLDQMAVQKLLMEGVYRRTGYSARALQQIAEQDKARNGHIREIKQLLFIGMLVVTALLMLIAGLMIVAVF